MEPRVPNHRLRKDEFPVPEDTDTPLISEPVLEMSEDDRTSPEKDKEQEEEEDDIPDAGAIEEEPSDASDVSEAAAEQASSSSSGDDPMVHTHALLLKRLRTFICSPVDTVRHSDISHSIPPLAQGGTHTSYCPREVHYPFDQKCVVSLKQGASGAFCPAVLCD